MKADDPARERGFPHGGDWNSETIRATRAEVFKRSKELSETVAMRGAVAIFKHTKGWHLAYQRRSSGLYRHRGANKWKKIQVSS